MEVDDMWDDEEDLVPYAKYPYKIGKSSPIQHACRLSDEEIVRIAKTKVGNQFFWMDKENHRVMLDLCRSIAIAEREA